MPHDDITVKLSSNVLEEKLIQPSTLENIDRSLFEYIDNEFDISCDTNKGFKKAPVVWLSAERAFQIKNNKEMRDDKGILILPIITVERTSLTHNLSNKGIFQAHVPPMLDEKGGSITIGRVINQDKTSNFANADAYKWRKQVNFPKENKKVVYQNISIPLPVHVEMMYRITLRCEYQQQMNQMVTPFITRTGAVNHFLLRRNEHKYEAFIEDSFTPTTNSSNLGTDEKMYQADVNIKVLGYIIGEDKNQEQPKIVIRENAVEAKMPRERVITKDSPEHIDKRGFYRE
jgi:hypothetical protein